MKTTATRLLPTIRALPQWSRSTILLWLVLVVVFVCDLAHTSLYAQATRTVTGKVTDDNARPLNGVKVLVKGTRAGAFSRKDGSYSLIAPDGAKTLVFEYVGMKALEKPIADVVDATLKEDILKLEEIVVTSIGIEQKKKGLGFAVQEVKGNELVQSREVSIINALASKAAGVQVISSSGMAGAGASIQIRGASSITGANSPLFVIDGIPIDNSEFNSSSLDPNQGNTGGVAATNRAIDINPDDIAALTILKGPAATALYGIRAASGAIIITTKRGSNLDGGKVNISFNTSLGIDNVTQLPQLQNKFSQGLGGIAAMPDDASPARRARSWGALLDTLRRDPNRPNLWDKNGTLIGQTGAPANATRVTPYDNMNSFFRTGITLNNSLSVSGGTNIGTYFFSVANLNAKGMVPGNEFSRTNVRFNGDYKLLNELKFTGSVAYTNSGGRRIQQGSNTSGVMLGMTRTPITFDNANGGPGGDRANLDAYQFTDGPLTGNQRTYRGTAGFDNPYWVVNNIPHNDRTDRLIGTAQIDYMPADWISIMYRAGTDLYFDKRKQFAAIGSSNYPAGQVIEDQHFSNDVNSDLIVTMNREFSDDFKGSLVVGGNLFSTEYENTYARGDGLTIEGFKDLSNAATVTNFITTQRKRTAAVYADAKIEFKNWLFVGATVRNEWSTSLPVQNNSFFYPSINLGLVFTEMLGMTDNEILSFGKIRANYAVVGKDAPVYSVLTTSARAVNADGWTPGYAFPFNGVPGFSRSNTLGNPKLAPEKTIGWEVGADLRFFGGRLNLDVAYFNDSRDGQIFAVSTAPATGYQFQLLNAGLMENSGIEVVLNATAIKTQDFALDFTLNFSRIRNRVVRLAPGVQSVFLGGFGNPQSAAVAGYPLGQFFGGVWLRDANNNIVIDDERTIGGAPNPNYGYPIADPVNRSIADPNPDWLGGFRTTVTYQGLTISALLDVRQGGFLWNGTRGALVNYGMAKETENRGSTKVFAGVKGHLDVNGNLVSSGQPNDVSAVLNQAWYLGNGGGFGNVAEDFIDDGSWVRLREATLSYSLPSAWFEGGIINRVSVTVTGRNLWLSTKYNGVDPETSLNGASGTRGLFSNNGRGIDYFNMPNSRSFVFGLSVGF